MDHFELSFYIIKNCSRRSGRCNLGTRANEFARESLRIKLGLDKPLINQYIEYLNQLIHGNLGISLNTQEPVKVIISKALPASLELAIFSILIASFVGYLIGFLGAVKPESKIDFSGRIFGIGTYALPLSGQQC